MLCQTSTGDSWQLPFADASPHVRIGHTVSFSLAPDGASLAVDLEVIQEKTSTSSVCAEKRQRSIQEKAAKPVVVLAKQQPSRKLQRSITRFHNADLEERLQMLEAAETLLSDLLNAVELDGDAICKLLCRCAGWLHAPGSFEARHIAATQVAATDAATVSDPSGLQRRVRRLLISALSSLDLSDITTYQAVETAVVYIVQLMQGKETLFCGNGQSLAVRQWRQLRELLVIDDAQRVPAKRKASDETETREFLQDKVAKRVSKDRSTAIASAYRPNERIRSLPSVYEATDRVVLLQCSKCVTRISTSWFWKQPRHGRIYAVVPHNGHQTCGRKLGKRCPWISLEGTRTCLDNFEQLDFRDHKCRRSLCKECGGREICPHNRQRKLCKECGGSSICIHNRQRSLCKDCGGRGICPHNRQRSFCKECGGSSICRHNRQRSYCKACGGSGICPPGRRRYRCSACKTQTRR